MESYGLLASLWIGWCVIHSLLIATPVTGWIERRRPAAVRYHRLAYNLVALGTLVAVVYLTRSVDGPMVLRWEGALVILRVLLLGVALFFLGAGARHYDFRQFLGLRQLESGTAHASLTIGGELQTTGILGVTRHPWYLASLALIWARNLDTADLIVTVILSLYLIVGAMLEERKLIAVHGDVYRDYQRRVSMLVPVRFVAARLRRDGSRR